MSFITIDEISELRGDREERFVALEQIVRERYLERLHFLEETQHSGSDIYALEYTYVCDVLTAAKRLEIEALSDWPIPEKTGDQDCEAFLRAVEFCVAELKHVIVERKQGNLARIEEATKIRVRRHLDNIRNIVDAENIEDWKKDRLHTRLTDFQEELERGLSGVRELGPLIIDFGAYLNDAAQKVMPSIEGLVKALQGARADEKPQEQIIANPRPKQLNPPPKKEREKTESEIEEFLNSDECPF